MRGEDGRVALTGDKEERERAMGGRVLQILIIQKGEVYVDKLLSSFSFFFFV